LGAARVNEEKQINLKVDMHFRAKLLLATFLAKSAL
jgi:hypothetical protein